MIVFSNPGQIDPRLITTLGVNVKEGASPIGFFGTGLKYAIAVLLRNGQNIAIWNGKTCFSFTVVPTVIREKEFGFIRMFQTRENEDGEGTSTSQQLGFTTDLGKNWTLQNAYRELHCNCFDEKGFGGMKAEHYAPQENTVNICVSGEAFELAHTNRHEFLLDQKRAPLFSNDAMELYLGRTKKVFYKGIHAYTLSREAAFTINMTQDMDLTEDRTIQNSYDIEHALGHALSMNASPEIIEACVLNDNGYEHTISTYSYNSNASQDFINTIKKCIQEHPSKVAKGARETFWRAANKKLDYTDVKLTAVQQAQLVDAIEICTELGYNIIEYPIRVVESLGENVLGLAHEGTIFASVEVFRTGYLQVLLVEEYLHLKYRVSDHTREMQTLLVEEIIRVGTRAKP